ncbi:hypothetical protein [Microbacterium sp. zg-YB36]|uniref:hypothetical protein n=1 Tax=Microbacterium sp. zg-YB36 TaxID=2969407 RepID=UPI00214CD7A9|nr:hypothetical protein [Microbacterium sp. zg-YB36]MDL5351166.1 hypothetical protein [Microbacterium sp. zg-YB36]
MTNHTGLLAPAPAMLPAIGTRIRAMDNDGEVAGGGEVIALDPFGVTVLQGYVHRHNGVVVEQGATPMRYQRANHTFEPIEA